MPCGRERFHHRVPDDLDAVASEGHHATVEVPVRLATRRERELALADRVLAQRRLERRLRPPHQPASAWPLRGCADRPRRAAIEERHAIGRAEQLVGRPFGVGHEPDDVAALAADAGDVVEAPVRVVDVAQRRSGRRPRSRSSVGASHT